MNCPVCKNVEASATGNSTRDASVVDCPQCGEFNISRRAGLNLRTADDATRWKISAWINEFGPSTVSSTDIDAAVACMSPSLRHRADRMLRWIHAQKPPGTVFSLDELGKWKLYEDSPLVGGQLVSSRLVPIGWNRTLDEMAYMVGEVLCSEMGLLVREGKSRYQVSPKGLLYLEGNRDVASSIGFCAMWFSPEVKPLWTDVIEPAIRAAGYEPLRIDSKEHNGKIDDEIMASIRASRFVVSDFTGNRGGVYYEAVFAHGLGLPVVFMCRDGDDLHFDVRQYNCIFWKPDALDEARDRLKNRILATLGQGPLRVQ